MELGEDVKRSNAEKKVHVGAVYYAKDSEANKLKMHVIVGMSSGSLTSVAVRINSEVNKWTPLDEVGYHIPIAKSKNAFLRHDSYLNCSKLLPQRSKDELEEYFYSNPDRYLGALNSDDLAIAKITLSNAHTIKKSAKEPYGLNLRTQ